MTENEREEAVRQLTPSAEEAVIGAMLIEPDCVGEVLTRVREEDFLSPRLRALFTAARELYLEQKPIDVVTVMNRAGGDELRPLAMECMDLTPTARAVGHYCEAVREQAALRRLHEAAEELGEVRTVEEGRRALSRAESILTDRPGVTVVSLTEMMADFMQRMSKPQPDYLRWGLGILDDMLHTGPGSYVIVAARPSTGKTALALQLGLNIAQRRRVGFYSLETTPEVAADRIAAARLGLSLPSIKKRALDLSDMTVMAGRLAKEDVFRGSFDFISAGSMTVEDIRAMALARRHEVVMIDYVQLIRPTARGDRAEQMQQVSMALRGMAQLTGVTVVALAQLRRPDTQGKAKAPTMADLKESGQFEQDADSILLMYLEDGGKRTGDRLLKIEKNKEGYAGFRARLRFDGARQTFTPVDKDGNEFPQKGKLEPADEQMKMEEPPEGW